MNELIRNASERDLKLQQDLKQIEEKKKRLREYNRNVAKLNAWMIRSEENMPTDLDIKKLELCMCYFKKD